MLSLNLSQFAQVQSATTTSEVSWPLVIVILFVVFIVTFVFYLLPSIITSWQLFTKAGKPGWAIIVPVYNCIVMSDIAKRAKWVGITAGVLSLITNVPYLGTLLALAYLGFIIYILAGFIKQFDQGFGFWFAYIIIPLVSVFLVKKAKYTGADAIGAQPNVPQNSNDIDTSAIAAAQTIVDKPTSSLDGGANVAPQPTVFNPDSSIEPKDASQEVTQNDTKK